MANKTFKSLTPQGLDTTYKVPATAPEYSATNTYAVGDLAVYQGVLYKCTTAIDTPEAWTVQHWQDTTIGDEVSDLKESLNTELYGGEVTKKAEDVQVGYYVNNSYNNNTSFRYGYADIKGATTVVVDLSKISDSANIEVLNSEKVFVRNIEAWATGTRTITKANNEAYLRLSARTDDLPKIEVNYEKNDSFDARIDSLDAHVDSFDARIDSMLPQTDAYSNVTERELEDIASGYVTSDGVVHANNEYSYGYVDIIGATGIDILQNGFIETSIAQFFDINKTVILPAYYTWSGDSLIQVKNIPNNAAYLVYSFKNVDANKTTFKIYKTGIQNRIEELENNSAKYDGAYGYIRTINQPFIKGLHLDCGRKYFSVANIKRLIDQMHTSGLNTFQIYFSDHNGFRFGLDDMDIEVDGITYDLSQCLGDGVSPTDGSGKWLTETDMDEIIAYANNYGITVIPAFDMPGHMGAIRQVFSAQELQYSPATPRGRKFMIAILTKYVDYFESKGCKYFNICADESSLDLSVWESFVFLACKTIAQHNMTPLLYNDGVCKNGFFDPFVAVGAIVLGWVKREDNASFKDILNCGYKMVNAAGNKFYWILGTTVTTEALIERIKNYDIFSMSDGTIIPELSGAMYHIWCDQADADGADDGDNVVAQTLPCIAAFGEAVAKRVPYDYPPAIQTLQTEENFESTKDGGSVILRSANGTKYAISVSNTGELTVSELT